MASRYSARTALLAEHRNSYRGFGGNLRVNPGARSLGRTASTIGKSVTMGKLQDNINQYNSGLISNNDMLSFLQNTVNDPNLTPTERASVSQQIRNFNVKVQEDSLNAAYQQASDPLARSQAAKALSDFYSSQAANSQAGTPAQSDYLAKAGQWSDTSSKDAKTYDTQNRSLQRAQLMYKVSQFTPKTEEEANQKAQAFTELAQQAAADGNQTEAYQYQTQAQNALNEIPTIKENAQKAEVAATRTNLVNTLNAAVNQYHDGKITADEFSQVLSAVDQKATEIGDTSLNLAVNKWSDYVAKDVQKGVQNSALNGLPVRLGRGSGGAGGDTNWDQQDFNFSDNLRVAQAMFQSGKWDAKTYAEMVGKALQEQADNIDQRVQTLETVAQNNPDAKVYYEGKKQTAAEVLKQVYTQQDNMQGQVQAYQTGHFGLVETAPKEFNQSGALSGTTTTVKGKSLPTYELVDTTNMPKDQYIQDTNGVYHMIQRGITKLNAQQLKNDVASVGSSAFYTDPKSGQMYQVKFDSSGNPYIENGKQYVDIYEPGTSNKVTRDINPGDKTVQAMSDKELQQFAKQTSQATASAVDKTNPDALVATESGKQASGSSDVSKFIEGNQQKVSSAMNEKFPLENAMKSGAAAVGNVLKGAANQNAQDNMKVMDAVGHVVQPVANAVEGVVHALAPQPPKVIPSSQIPANTPLTPPSTAMPQTQQVSAGTPQAELPPNPASPSSPLTVVGQPDTNNIQRFAQQTGTKISIPGPNPSPIPQGPANLGQLFGSIGNGIRGFATSIFPSFFGGK